MEAMGLEPSVAEFSAFTVQTRLSGTHLTDGTELHKGSVASILRKTSAALDTGLAAFVDPIARSDGTPLPVSQNARIRGAIHLKCIIKLGVRE